MLLCCDNFVAGPTCRSPPCAMWVLCGRSVLGVERKAWFVIHGSSETAESPTLPCPGRDGVFWTRSPFLGGVSRVVSCWLLMATKRLALPSITVSRTRYAPCRWPHVVTYGATDAQGGEMRLAGFRLLNDSGYNVPHPWDAASFYPAGR